VGVPVTMGLFLEVNPLVLVTMWINFAVHYATAFWDVAYASPRRQVRPNEQHFHGLLEVLPFMAVSFMSVLYRDRLAAALRGRRGRDDWRFRLKRHPLPVRYRTGILAAVAAFIAIPYAEELWRCVRARRPRQTRNPGQGLP